MRIVKLSDLSENERKKVLEEQQSRIENNKQASEQIRLNANNQFNNMIKSEGAYQPKSTTNMSNLLNTYKNNSNNSYNDFKKNNNLTLWGQVKQTANNLRNDIGSLSKLVSLGASSGTKQVGTYIENANENNFSNYKRMRKNQFLASKNVSEEDKASAKMQNNLLLQMNGIDTKNNIETNLVKKTIQDSIKKDEQKIQEEQNKLSNVVTQKLGEIAPSMGQMIPGTIASTVNPVLGTAYFTTSSGGSYIDDAKQRGMTDEQAFKYGTVMGALEGASEAVITGQQLNKVKKAFTGKEISKKVLDSYGFNIFENAVQEAVMEPAQEITAGIVGDKANWTDMGQRIVQSGFNGALMGAIFNGATYGLEKSGILYDKIKKGQQVTETEYREALQENIDTFGKDAVENNMKNGAIEVYQKINDLQSQSTQNKQMQSTQQITPQDNNVAQNGNMGQNVINEFNGYTQKEMDNIKSDKISIAQSNEDISNFVNNSRKVPGNFKMYLGKITQNASNAIKNKLGINVDNYNISLKTDDVRKIFKDHGSEKTEVPRGQIPITENDFLNIPNIINNPDIVSEAGKSPQGKPVIKFEKNINGNNVVVTYVSDKHNNLELQTMYKFKNNKKIDSATALHENQTPGLNTSEMDSGTNLFINNSISQNEQNVKNDTINNNYMQNTENNTQAENSNKSSFSLAQKQFDIIQKNNLMTDDYHVGIRNINDIKTFKEAMQDDESFYYGDFSREDAQKALEKGTIMVYSSKPIEQGGFVSTSKNMAQDYAGNGKVYSQEVNLDDVAWINGDEVQYAKVENTQNIVYNNTNESESGINDRSSKENISTTQNQQLETGNTTNQTRLTKQEYERYKTEINNEIKSKIKENFGFDDKVISNITNKIINNKNIIKDDVLRAFDDNREITIELEDTDKDTVKQIRNTIRNTKLDTSQLKNSVTDWNDWRKSNFGKLRLGNDGISIDSFYQELSNSYPEYFNSDITNIADQLDMISDFMNNDEWLNNTVETYILTDEDLSDIADYIVELNGIVNTLEIEDNNSFNLPKKQEKINLPTKGETIDWNEIERPEGKIRKHYKSIIESPYTTKEAKAIARELMGTDTYIPDSNNKQLERANSRIENSGPDSELDSLLGRAKTGGKIDATDIAVGERLIQYYSKIGDKTKLQDAIHATAMAGTTAGQTVQAMALLNHQTPEGQVVWIERSIEKINNEMKNKRGDKVQQFDFTPEMQEKILNSKNKNELEQNLEEVYKELGQQVHKSKMGQIDSWRYFSMLGNPRTHIRNIVGNFFMGKIQDTKNKVAGAIEGTVAKFNPEMERTHTIKRASKEVLEFAKKDIQNVSGELGLSDNKYKPQSRIENNMRTFKSNAMENTLGRLFKTNDNLLEAEDGWGLKAGYKKAMSEYITANKIDINNITDEQLAKARKFAIQEAQERTFHQANAVASAINSFFGKNKTTKAVGDAVLPFVKTPANVAKAGIEYSPAGLAKSIIYDSVQLRKGNIDANQYISNISKGLTGSAITVLGYALAEAGVLKASGSDDDKKEKFDQQNGKQAYSIQIGDKTYSLDWLAPAGIPLMVGAEIYEGLNQKDNEKTTKSTDDQETLNKFLEKAEVLSNSLSNTLDPMVEMSMISGLTSTVKSFAQGNTQALGSMLTNGAKSYVNQFVPTALGQIAKTTDTVERDTTSTKSGSLAKAFDSTVNQMKSKIPGLRQSLPTKKDIWGEDIKLSDNWPQRFFEAGILPMSIKKLNEDNVVTKLNELYDKTGNSSILPTTIEKTFTINGEKYRMTDKEYNEYKANYGKNSYKLIDSLVKTKEYKNLNDEQKQKAIENVYSYAKEKNKIDYGKKNKLEQETTTLYKTLEDLKQNGGDQSSYLSYIGKVADIQGNNVNTRKNEILNISNYTDKTKKIIYQNTTGKDDELYNLVLANSKININEYLEYKIKESNKEFEADKNADGKSISGSSKIKYYNYVNNNISDPGSRLLILGSKYKLSNNDRYKLTDYINQTSKNNEEATKIFEKLNNNYVIKNGKVYYK